MGALMVWAGGFALLGAGVLGGLAPVWLWTGGILAGWGTVALGGRWPGPWAAASALVAALLLAQALLQAYAVPAGLIPQPSLVGQALWTSYPVLLADAYTTLVQEALPGYLAGGASGILAGALLARYEFLRRGLLPYAAAFASVPIVALAPVAIHLLGLGWQSKALVAGVSVFFPVLVGTVSGLTQVKQPALDLFSSYSANQRQVFAALRFPAALPQIFNALKIASTLALIGAIVAEFFGSQGSGLGFRIQIEAGRFGFDLVWAAIAVASLLGIVWYGLVAALERRLTGWHPSFREVK